MTVKVFQGEREMAADNRLLGQFNLEGIPPAPRGLPQIEVTFDIDANGIVKVSAKDMGTGKKQRSRCSKVAGLSEKEIEAKLRDAESHAEEDKKKRTLAEARNKAEAMCWETEKQMKEFESKLRPADKEAMTSAIQRTREAAKGDDAEAIKAALGQLEQAWHAFSKTLYERTGAAPGATPGAEAGPSQDGAARASGGGDDDTIDAEFEVKKE